jgi:hypothetical protein
VQLQNFYNFHFKALTEIVLVLLCQGMSSPTLKNDPKKLVKNNVNINSGLAGTKLL